MLVGTLDEQVLARYPELVSEAEEHLYCGNSVKGVTDCGLKGGVKYKDMQKGEKWTSME